MRNNPVIAFEGIDGCGKSTQVKILTEKLKREGLKVYNTFEPTDSPIGSLIRNVFRRRIEAENRTIAGLFVADRLDHLLNKTDGLLKKLEEGYTIIIDRYYLSSYAYQGAHVPMNWVIEANRLSAELMPPDIHIYIDISPELSMERIAAGRNSTELYETHENLKLVRSKYQEAIELIRDKENVFITRGDRSESLIANDIWKEVKRLIRP